MYNCSQKLDKNIICYINIYGYAKQFFHLKHIKYIIWFLLMFSKCKYLTTTTIKLKFIIVKPKHNKLARKTQLAKNRKFTFMLL